MLCAPHPLPAATGQEPEGALQYLWGAGRRWVVYAAPHGRGSAAKADSAPCADISRACHWTVGGEYARWLGICAEALFAPHGRCPGVRGMSH